MLRDVFYYGKKPNVHPREQYAENLEDARLKATTRDFWIINEFCDYRNFVWDFDFEFLPDEDVWAENHNNVWPSQHQKDSGTWLCPKEHSDIIIYRGDVDPVIRKNERNDNWVFLEKIDESKFDFSWHPDPTDPPYIYKWGCKFFPAELKHVLEYVVPGATQEKYMNTTIELLPNDECWVEYELIDKHAFDMSWRPDPLDPAFIYVWGNKWVDGRLKPTLEYHVPGATDKKYMPEQITVLPEWDKWSNFDHVDKNKFDFSWRPDPREPDFIYEFATQWQRNGGPRYHVPGATDMKYTDIQKAITLPNMSAWEIPDNVDATNFDFSWHPDWASPPYIYQFPTQWALSGGPRYVMENATEIKYEDCQSAKTLVCMDNWEYDPSLIDMESFDFSWHPYMEDQPYIYVFGTQWQKTGGPKYHTPGTTATSPVKYVDTRIIKAKRLPKPENFKILNGYVVQEFDYSWHPDDTEDPYTYVFGNTLYPATEMPTIEYTVEGATQVKYINDVVAKLGEDRNNWKIVEDIVEDTFDFSWRPNPNDPPYIYVFGNTQYPPELYPTVEYHVDGATEKKYVTDIVAKLKQNKNKFTFLHPIVESTFDFSWRPNPKDPPYNYIFGNTQYSAEDMPTVEYRVKGATETKYVTDIVATLAANMTNWELADNVDATKFDFSWVPHPASPPYIYQFGTLVDDIWVEDGPKYVTPGNDGFVVRLENSLILTDDIVYPKYYIETTLEDLVNEHPTELFWALNKNINYDSFDFSWKPEKENLFNVTVFGSPESETTHTYFVNAPTYLEGHTGLNFIQQDQEIDEKYLAELFVKPDMFYVDRGNSEANSRFEALKAQFGNKIQKTRYLNSWADTVNRCINRSTTDLVWVLNSELDYSNFDFNYYPNPWQMKMVHVFGTQWSHWGTTFLVNRESFPDDTKYIKIIEHLSCLNFVKNIRAKATQCVHDIVVIDHGNSELSNVLDVVNSKACGKNVTTVPYNNSYFETFKNIIKKQQEKKEHYIWVCSSVCDYTDFDFSYICDPYARDQLHVFPSGMQKFGDTFFVDVNKAREVLNEIEKLDEYKINFNNTIRAKRLPEPVIVTAADTHIAAAKNVAGFPYVTLITQDNVDLEETVIEPMNLWAPDTKNILITSTGGTRIVVPTEVKDHVSTELYEYPYIKRMPKLAKSKALDIVFVSNGETVAEQNYEHLLNVTKGLNNKIHRVDGINGRTEALHAAAEASETPWFFGVPAKLFVNKKFDWNYQADRMQMPKHYIFNAHNPVNDLFYGHQSMVLYNKNLVLGNKGVGLDFTLDSPHMSVELNSGIVVGDTDEYSTWRTAFREAVKLKKYSDNGDEIAMQRLDVWTSVGKGNYGEWSIKGALDGIEFYNEANSDLATLRQSYYWDWLKDRFDSKY